MITSTFLEKQRLGNQLFIYASLLGIAKKNNTTVNIIPSFNKYIKHLITVKKEKKDLIVYKEPNFNYTPVVISPFSLATNYDMLGYFQSYKYFDNIPKFEFQQEYINKADKLLSFIPYKKKIAIHIRRGDYVDNPNYVLLPPIYYIKALIDNFPDWKDYGIMIFSDDIPYCRVHFGCLENVYFAEGNSDIEDLILMSRCDHFIISNSSYSWWSAYLGEKKDSIVVRPKHHFAGKLLETHDIKDLYPEHWKVHDHLDSKIDLSDTTIVIPVKYDHEHRKKNLDLVVCMLQKDYNVNIVIGEQAYYRFQFSYMMNFGCRYDQFAKNVFHRTYMLNSMIRSEWTKNIVVNYDADVIIPPMQMYLAVEAIRNGDDMVYPYDGRFARMERVTWFKELEKRLDIGFVKNTIFNGMKLHDNLHSVGGCILFNRDSFLEGGGENEEFISFGDEDNERYYRFFTLGYKIKRIKGVLYHINHFTGPDSSTKNPYWKKNRELWNKIKQMNKQELLEYIKQTFKWKIK
jgi:hypothetical protein